MTVKNGKPPVLKTYRMTLVHRLQRSWPFVRINSPITILTDIIGVAADYPPSQAHLMGIHIDLNSVKQGRYNLQPATLLTFEVSLSPVGLLPETCIEIRLASLSGKTAKGSAPYIGAYGPADLVEWPYPHGGPAVYAHEIPATLQMRPTDSGALLTIRPRESNPTVGPGVFPFGIVAVHKESAQVRIIPSTTDPRRLRAFTRTAVNPINLDLDDQLGDPIISCAHQGQEGCHSTCDDFGSTHMTPAVWERTLSLRHRAL